MIAQRSLFLSTGILLAGCATVPHQAILTPTAQLVAARGNVALSWPESPQEESETNARVADDLQADLTVENAVRIAVLNNQGLRGTFEDLRLSQADILRASRLANPMLSASVRWPNQKPRGPDSEFSFAANLLDGLFIPLKRAFAQAQAMQAQKRVAMHVLGLITEVKIALYTLEAHQMLRARLATIVSVNDAAADLAKRQFDAGNINRLELLNQQVSAQEGRLELNRTDAQIRSDREVINRLLGLWGGQTNWKTQEVLSAPAVVSLPKTNYEALALRQRLDLDVARSEVDVARSNLGLKTSTRWLPLSVNVGVDTERESAGKRLTGPTIELSLPLFHQGQADVLMLTSEVRRAETSYAALAIAIRSDVREARDRLIAAAATFQFFNTTLLPQRKAILQETLLHYNAMQKSTYELLAAKQQELVAEREKIEALREVWVARAELEKAAGGSLPTWVQAPAAAEVGPK